MAPLVYPYSQDFNIIELFPFCNVRKLREFSIFLFISIIFEPSAASVLKKLLDRAPIIHNLPSLINMIL